MRINIIKISLAFVALFFSVLVLNAQNCVDYHKSACKKEADGSGYSITTDSRSGLLMKGQTSEFRFKLHQAKDYRISLCADPIFGEMIRYQILDFEEGTLLYDNAEFNYAKEFEFTVLISRDVKLVVSVPSDDKTQPTNTMGFKPKPTQMGCVGVIIESMITPKKGF